MPYNPNNGSYYNAWNNMYYQSPNTTLGQSVMPQSYAQQPSSQPQGIIWVDGEVGAKAFQMPQGWPAGVPIPLWDANEKIIYLKSMNQMGMPNPLQKIRYTIEENQMQLLPSQVSGNTQEVHNYATKDDMDRMKEDIREIREMLKGNQSGRNQNGSNSGERGGNR